jgi:hypothetical protein
MKALPGKLPATRGPFPESGKDASMVAMTQGFEVGGNSVETTPKVPLLTMKRGLQVPRLGVAGTVADENRGGQMGSPAAKLRRNKI